MRPFHALVRNLTAGFRLATLRTVAPGTFCCDASQVVLLALVAVLLAGVSAILRGAAPLAPLRDTLADVGTIVACGAVIGALRARPAFRREVPVILLSLAPAGTIAAGLLQSLATANVPSEPWLAASALYFAWLLLAHYRGIELVTGPGARRALPVYALYLALGFAAASLLPRPAAAEAPPARADCAAPRPASCP